MSDISTPSVYDLMALLGGWPENTVGSDEEFQMFETLRNLCEKQGYGRVRQVMEHMEMLAQDRDTNKDNLLQSFIDNKANRFYFLDWDLPFIMRNYVENSKHGLTIPPKPEPIDDADDS